MYIDQTNERRAPIFLATILLLILALSFFNLGPRFGDTLEVSGPANAAARYELFSSRRNTYYAFAENSVHAAWDPATGSAREAAAIYIDQSMTGRDYVVYFDSGASFVVSPGILRSSVTTSDQGRFTGTGTLNDSLADERGRSLEQVYPLYAPALKEILQSDSAVLSAHWPRMLIVLVLVLASLILTANRHRMTWFSQHRWQPYAITGTAIILGLAAMIVSSRIL